MSKWCNNRGRKLIYIITKLTCRRFRLSYILPPPPRNSAQTEPRTSWSSPGRSPGRWEGRPRPEPRGESGRYVTVSCRTSVCVSTLPLAVLQSPALLPSCRVSASFRHRPRRPTLRSVARFDHPACRRPGGRRVNTPPSSSLHQGLLVPLTRDHTAPTAADLAAAGPGALPALLVLRPELSSLELPWAPLTPV